MDRFKTKNIGGFIHPLLPASFFRLRPRVEAYLQTLSRYRKNSFSMDRAALDRVTEHWGFAVDAWGYEPPPTGATGA